MTEVELDALTLATADQMRKVGKWVSYDGRILPAEAAAILRRPPGTLANWSASSPISVSTVACAAQRGA